eukprot:81641-Chlamydomonas_euryale.AAC.8
MRGGGAAPSRGSWTAAVVLVSASFVTGYLLAFVLKDTVGAVWWQPRVLYASLHAACTRTCIQGCMHTRMHACLRAAA